MSSAAPQVRFGQWISEGWTMFTEQWKVWVLLALGLFVAVALPIIIFMVVTYAVMIGAAIAQAGSRGSEEPPMALLAIMFLGIFGLVLVTLPISAFLTAGMYRAAFKQLRGGTLEFRDLFSGKDCYWSVLGATLLLGLLGLIGGILCVIPAFIVAGLFYFTLPLIVDRGMSVVDAMRASAEATKPSLLMFILFALVVQLIGSAGSYACYVGLLATYPLMFTIHVIAFRDCFGVPGARVFSTAPAPAAPVYAPPPSGGYQQQQPGGGVCPTCRSVLPLGAEFCPTCGHRSGG